MNAAGDNPLVTHCMTGGTTQPNDDSFQQRAVAAGVGIEDGILATVTGHRQLTVTDLNELLVKSSQIVTTSKEH